MPKLSVKVNNTTFVHVKLDDFYKGSPARRFVNINSAVKADTPDFYSENLLQVSEKFNNVYKYNVIYKEEWLLVKKISKREMNAAREIKNGYSEPPPLTDGAAYRAFLVYDIECWSDETNIFSFYLAATYVACPQVNFFEEKIHATMVDMVNYFFLVYEKLRQLCVSRIYMLSFNGARFDDIFLTEALRKKLLDFNVFGNYMYGEKAGAIIFNNFKINGVSVVFRDVIRYNPAKSLRAMCEYLKVSTKKGFFPLKILLEKYSKNGLTCSFDELLGENKFWKPNYFFNLNDFFESKKIWELAGSAPIKPSDLWDMCAAYCLDDCKATWEVYVKLEENLITCAARAFDKLPPITCMAHFFGAPSMSKALALNVVELYRDFYVDGNEPYMMAPQSRALQIVSNARYGGFVGMFERGMIVDKELALVDIVSQYPNALTGLLPMGPARELKISDAQIILDNLAEYTLMTLPMFFIEVRAKPPEFKVALPSTLPQRGLFLTWSYLEQVNTYCSVDLFTAHSVDGWEFEALTPGIIYATKGQPFKFFVDKVGTLKTNCKAEGDLMGADTYKLWMNSMIGKLLEHSNRLSNILVRTDKDFAKLNRLLNENDTAVLTGVHHHDYGLGKKGLVDEYHMKEENLDENTILTHQGVVMYAYSRYTRTILYLSTKLTKIELPLTLAARMSASINSKDEVDVYYGDTDSFIVSRRALGNLQRHHGDLFNKNIRGFDTVTGKHSFSIELEIEGASLAFFLNLKTYLMFYEEKGIVKMKMRNKGHRSFSVESLCTKHPSFKNKNCEACACTQCGLHESVCYCAIKRLSTNRVLQKYPRNIDIKTGSDHLLPIHYLLALDGFRVFLSYNRFDRTLSTPRGELNIYQVKHISRDVLFQTVSLSHKYCVCFYPKLFPLGFCNQTKCINYGI